MSKTGRVAVNTKNLANSQPNEVDSNQYCLDIDPDLQRDVEIDLSHNIASAGTRRTLSGKSRKTTQSKHTEPNSENVVKSRGRPIKPHETEPFLCIDNLPPEKNFVSDKLVLKSNDPSRPSSHWATAQPTSATPSLGLQLQQMSSSFMSTFPQASPVPPRSAGSCTGRVTPVNTPFQSPNKQLRSPNYHVKQPFKHSVNKPDMTLDDRQTPSMGLKERTSLAAFHIQNMLSVAGEKHAHKVAGRLQKGKLKPLCPVQIEGPSIEKCRGIVSETHSYQPSPSRTLQRHLHLMNTIPNVHEYLYSGRPTTGESLHRTSVASCSSLDENVDNSNSVRAAPTDTDIDPEQTEPPVLEPVTPENTFVPIHYPEGLTDMTAMHEKTPKMFATEIAGRDYDETNKNEEDVQHELHIRYELDIGGYGETNNSNPLDCMPDGYEENPDGRCCSGSPSKSVRFVDGTTKEQNEYNNEMKQLVNEHISKPLNDSVCSLGNSQAETKNIITNDGFDDPHEEIESVAKRNKQNIKSSCKDDILENNCMTDSDDDSDQDKNMDSNGKNKNVNKPAVLSASKLESRNSKTDEPKEKKSTNKENGQKRNEKSHVTRPLSAKSFTSKINAKSRESRRSYVESKKSEIKNTSKMKLLDAVNQHVHYGHNQSECSDSGRCSRFNKSKANKPHINTLQVSSVLHGDRVAVGFGPESPTRSRSSSPKRHFQSSTGLVLSTDRILPSSEQGSDDNENSRHFELRSKAEFLLGGTEPEMETICLDDYNEIMLNQEINFDKLDSEIGLIRSVIQKPLLQETNENKYDQKCSEYLLVTDNSLVEGQSDAEKMQESSDDLDSVQERSDERKYVLDSVRESYYKLIEVYRKHCMERSEAYGVLSMSLVTSRPTNDMVSSTKLQSQKFVCQNSTQDMFGNVTHHDKKQKELAGNDVIVARLTTDSGQGSVDNLSELSQSASQAVSDVPKLDLGGSISDLGEECSETTVTPDNKDGSSIISTARDINLLEICCEQLSAMEKMQKTVSRKDRIRWLTRSYKVQREEDLASLQVVASTKSLCKNRVGKPVSAEIKATFPPLCFTVNARPPQGYLYYFAYGPDMNPDRFTCYIQHVPLERHWGLLFGFSLVFNKRGASEEAGGFANLEYNVLRSVEGCVYKITADDLRVLDKAVGYPEHYEHLMLPVWMCNSSNPDDVAQYCVPALTYIAQNRWTETERQLSCDYSVSQCVRSADIVTPNYKDFLVSVAKQPVSVLA